MIYLASYMEMTSENRSLLEEYVNSYSLAGMIHRHPADPGVKDRRCWSSLLFILWRSRNGPRRYDRWDTQSSHLSVADKGGYMLSDDAGRTLISYTSLAASC